MALKYEREGIANNTKGLILRYNLNRWARVEVAAGGLDFGE